MNAEESTATRFEIVTATRLYSLIQTCRVNNIEPYRYLRTLFHHLSHADGDVDYSALLPQFIEMTD